MERTMNILVTGVGGQGILMATEIIARVALKGGYDVKKADVHGMAQRGGTVISSVRFGEKVHSPVISRGEANVLLSFELLEGLRQLPYLRADGGRLVVNKQRIAPAPVSSGAMEYPADVEERIHSAVPDALIMDAFSLAKRAGSVRSVNVVLLGALAPDMPFDDKLWHEAISESVPKKTVDVNIDAFKLGRAERKNIK